MVKKTHVIVCLLVQRCVSRESLALYRAGGETLAQWQRNAEVYVHGEGCWERALGRLNDLSLPCSQHDEQAKSLLALSITHCNFIFNPSEFPDQARADVKAATGCDVDGAFERRRAKLRVAEGDPNQAEQLDAEIEKIIRSCKMHSTGATVASMAATANHLDNVCFYMHSELWQRQTERNFAHVADQLSLLDERHFELLEQADHLRDNLKSGNDGLQVAFSEMREQVNRESSKIVSLFDETFSVVTKVLHFQRAIILRLSGFETLLVYAVLILLSFYLTAAESTRSARGAMFAILTVMTLGEVLLRRYWQVVCRLLAVEWHNGFTVMSLLLPGNDEEELLHQVLRKWRASCATTACYFWFRAYWTYKNPTLILVEAVEDLKQQVQAIRHETVDQLYLAAAATTDDAVVPRNPPVVLPQMTAVAARAQQRPQKSSYRRLTELVPALFRSSEDNSDDDDSSAEYEPPDDKSSGAESSVSLEEENASSGEEDEADEDTGGVAAYGTNSPVVITRGGTRRNPRRAARPRSFRPPTNFSDVQYLKLNPVLLLESSQDFVQLFERRDREWSGEEEGKKKTVSTAPTAKERLIDSRPTTANSGTSPRPRRMRTRQQVKLESEKNF